MSDDKKSLGEEVKIPAHIFVRCPLTAEKTGFKQWKLRQARKCDDCEHFHGLTQRMSQTGGTLPFETEFAVRCGYPMDRDLFAMEVDPE